MPRPNVETNKCLNPKARTCDCPSCREEKGALASLRNQVIYSGIPGSIVEWTLSDEWTDPMLLNPHNGECIKAETTTCGNSFAGEIPWR